MRAVRLIAESDDFDSSPGLRVVGIPKTDDWMAAREGLLIAHDLIEHQNGIGNIGTVWDELEALGGIWHVRGRWGDMMTQNIHSPHVNIAADITRMSRYWQGDSCPPRKHLPRRTNRCDYDQDFHDILDQARKDIPGEIEHDELENFDLDAYLAEALDRMRIGFRKCWRRFGGSGFASNDQFRAIMDVCDPVAKHLDFEGQEFILTYGGGKARIREVTEQW